MFTANEPRLIAEHFCSHDRRAPHNGERRELILLLLLLLVLVLVLVLLLLLLLLLVIARF